MKNLRTSPRTNTIIRPLLILTVVCALFAPAAAQTAGGTEITNQASAT